MTVAKGNENTAAKAKENGKGKTNEKFRTLAEARVTGLNARGRQVATLASYPHDKEEADAIIGAAFKVAHAVKSAFEKAGQPRDNRDKFSF